MAIVSGIDAARSWVAMALLLALIALAIQVANTW
jgi:hypothetical protein